MCTLPLRLIAFGAAIITSALHAAPTSHLPASSAEGSGAETPEGKRVPFGWDSVAVAPPDGDASLILKWDTTTLPEGDPVNLRIAVALECREKAQLSFSLAESGGALGVLDVSFASVLQIAELPLTRPQAEQALAQGIRVTQTVGKNQFRIFSPTDEKVPAVLRPHFCVAKDSDRWAEFLLRMESLDTIQPFGWMEGCMLLGVHDLATIYPERNFQEALAERIELFTPGGDLIYENTNSGPMKNSLHTIEGTLPFAVISQVKKSHPSVQVALDFWEKHLQKSGFAKGSIQNSGTCSAEGAYTIAYPMMVIANQRGDKEMAQLALDQIRIRTKLLKDEEGNIFLRNVDGNHVMKNWARGVAWYYLGLMRTIIEAPEGMDTTDIRADAIATMEHVLKFQQPDGLWRNFFDDPEQKIDTSGSVGIAAALALGAKNGILPPEAEQAARKTLNALAPHLTPDGLLAMGTPSNRGSAAQGNRREIFPVGMGLTAQLIAALGGTP